MPHYFIVGRTECGKTTLGKIIANDIRKLIANGKSGEIKKIAVVNPHLDPWPMADYQVETVSELQPWLRKKENVGSAVFVEETGIALEDDPGLVKKWCTTYRHLGHSFYFLGQRFIQLPPNMRGMIKGYFVFRVSEDDAYEISREFSQPAVRSANVLENGHFYYLVGKHCLRGSIEWKSRSFSLRPLTPKK